MDGVKSRKYKVIAVFILLFAAASQLNAQTIKLGSLFPEGTGWDTSLKRMAAEWTQITGGRVRVQIYPGGIAGEEGDMIRKMRFGQLDAAVLTSFGMKVLVPETFVVSLPGLLDGEAELDYVLDNFMRRFDQKFRDQGFEVMAWSKSGWAYVFSKNPIFTPDDLRLEILAVSTTEEEIVRLSKAQGFKVVSLGVAEMMVALQSRMATAFYTPPVASAAYQWFAMAPNMTNFRLAPVLGGLVLSRRAWARIPEQYHEELKASMQKLAQDFYVESLRLNDEAMRVMNANGLRVIEISETQKALWRSVMSDGRDLLIGDGKSIPTVVYTELMEELENLRK